MDIKEKNSFIMYTDYLKHVQKLEMKQRGELFTAILMYASTGEIPELDSEYRYALRNDSRQYG